MKELEFVETRRDGVTSYGYLREKPKTNADRIRAMTNEELAYFHVGMGCPPGIDVYEKCHDIGAVPPVCLKCWLEWLESEADNG